MAVRESYRVNAERPHIPKLNLFGVFAAAFIEDEVAAPVDFHPRGAFYVGLRIAGQLEFQNEVQVAHGFVVSEQQNRGDPFIDQYPLSLIAGLTPLDGAARNPRRPLRRAYGACE